MRLSVHYYRMNVNTSVTSIAIVTVIITTIIIILTMIITIISYCYYMLLHVYY